MALIRAAVKEGSHCLIEWDELNNPVSVVDRKNVKSVDGDSEPDVGEMCSIRCRERSRWVEYPGKLLAVGSKKEMELEMARLDDLGSSDGEDEESAQVTSEAEKTVFKDTHCLIEWDEPNTPPSIMERMNVKSVDGDSELSIGDMCLVRCRERSRWVEYPGKLLAMGSRKDMKVAITNNRETAQASSEEVSEIGRGDTAGDAEMTVSKGGQLAHDMTKEDIGGGNEDDNEASSEHQSEREGSDLYDEQPARKKRKTVRRKVCKKSVNSAKGDDDQPVKKRRQVAIASKPCKKKAAAENMRVTEQLLDGLVSPTESPEKSPPQSLPKGFVLAGNVSPGNISIGDGYLSEEDEPQLISMPVQGQSTPRVKDLTNKGTLVGWERSVQGQLDNLKLWLELQFATLNQKVDGIAEDVKSRKRHKKVYQDVSVEGGRSDFDDKSVLEESVMAGSAEPTAAGQSAAGKVKTGKLEIVCGNPKSKHHLVLSLPSEAAVALFHSVNCCPPPDAGTFAKKLLDVFFSEEELARSCCTKAVGRELLDQTVLLGIKYQTFYKYPVPKEQADDKWSKIVRDKLNMRCRTCRRKLNSDKENIHANKIDHMP